MPDTPDSSPVYDKPSKSQVKRDMQALHDLGVQLVDLPADRLKQLPLSEALLQAIRQAQRITSREGRRRQIHYVGKLMRQADAQAIRTQLVLWQHGSQEQTRALHRLESLRDRLITDDAALTGFLTAYPGADVQQLRALIRAARKEASHNASLPPDTGGTAQKKHYRALYQALKHLVETTEET